MREDLKDADWLKEVFDSIPYSLIGFIQAFIAKEYVCAWTRMAEKEE